MKDYNYYKAKALKVLEETYGDTAQMIQAYKDIHTITNSLILIDVMENIMNGAKNDKVEENGTSLEINIPKQTKNKK